MPYIEGFVTAVPTANKDAYLKHAAGAADLFKEFGVARFVEAWGDDVSEGQTTDFRRAVKAEAGEEVLFSWFEYPDRAARDAANEKIMSDPRMAGMMEAMPFDGKRMIYGGFAGLVDAGPKGPMGYVDGVLAAVPTAAEADYRAFSEMTADVFLDHGAIRVVDAWGDDVPDGEVTDYRGAVKAEDGETVTYGWVEWPSKEARDAGWKALTQDPRMQPGQPMPFDGKRMVFGGFAPILDV